LDINHRCLEGGKVKPFGAENKPPGGVDTEAELGYKNKCRSGGQKEAAETNPLTTAESLLQ